MQGGLRYWCNRSVDGSRTDGGPRILKDPQFRDNPPNPAVAEQYRNGFLGQLHLHDENHPDIHDAFRAIHRLLDSYGDRMMVGEIVLTDPVELVKYLGRGDELHLAFYFPFLYGGWDAARFRQLVEGFEALCPPEAWPTWVLSNHDVVRHATRFDDARLGDARARLAAMLVLTLRGTPLLYCGEEIGMHNVPIPRERMQDPLARTLHPNLCRDGERTPMCWDPSPQAGFTASQHPWLPVGPQTPGTDVATQRDDRGSLLWLYKDLLALRRATPALRRGTHRSLDAPADVFAFERRCDGQTARVALNFGDTPCTVAMGTGRAAAGLRTDGAPIDGALDRVELPPCTGAVVVIR